MRHRLIIVGGLVAWIAVGIPVIIQGANYRATFIAWSIAFAIFGAAFAFGSWRPGVGALAVEVAAVITMVLLLCNGYEGLLLVLVAMQVPGLLSRRAAITWIAVQNLLLFAGIAIHWSPRPAFMLTPPYLGFQLLAYLAFEALAREAAARRELQALHGILVDSSRIAERLRIARDLHDSLGHHLTALSLNLEAALQKIEGDPRDKVQLAQTITRQLLGEVRGIIASTGNSSDVDLQDALQKLIAGIPKPRIHLQVAPDIRLDDPERAHVVVRCAQEIVTNAARHSGAENLWIVIDRDGKAIRIRGRDDGRGSANAPEGFGLRSMRTRVENAGGELRHGSAAGAGFEIVALVPDGRA